MSLTIPIPGTPAAVATAARGAAAAAAIFGSLVAGGPGGAMPNDAAASEGTSAEGQTAAATAEPALIPREEAAKAFKSRDAAKAEARRANAMLDAVLGRFGATRQDLKVLENGSGLEVTAEQIEQAVSVVENVPGTMQDLAKARREAGALRKLVEKEYAGEIGRALIAEGALVESADELASLLQPYARRELQFDDETGEAVMALSVSDPETGKPMATGDGKPATLNDLARAWLAKRPHFKRSGLRSGPGAGGRGIGGQPGGGGAARPMTLDERSRDAARVVFGPVADRAQNRGAAADIGEVVFGLPPRQR